MFKLLLFSMLLTGTLPGQPTTPAQLQATLPLRPSDMSRLVLLRNAAITNLEDFTSASGRRNLRLTITVAGTPYAAVAYQGEWTPALRAALASGQADVAGVWATFQDAPSFTVKFAVPAGRVAAPKTDTASAPLLRIRDARVTPGSVRKFVAQSQATHVTYTFTVGGKAYQGVVYAGVWNSSVLTRPRSGNATLYGRWGTFEGKPNFVTTRVEP